MNGKQLTTEHMDEPLCALGFVHDQRIGRTGRLRAAGKRPYVAALDDSDASLEDPDDLAEMHQATQVWDDLAETHQATLVCATNVASSSSSSSSAAVAATNSSSAAATYEAVALPAEEEMEPGDLEGDPEEPVEAAAVAPDHAKAWSPGPDPDPTAPKQTEIQHIHKTCKNCAKTTNSRLTDD